MEDKYFNVCMHFLHYDYETIYDISKFDHSQQNHVPRFGGLLCIYAKVFPVWIPPNVTENHLRAKLLSRSTESRKEILVCVLID
jgi:hypothetical protein